MQARSDEGHHPAWLVPLTLRTYCKDLMHDHKSSLGIGSEHLQRAYGVFAIIRSLSSGISSALVSCEAFMAASVL